MLKPFLTMAALCVAFSGCNRSAQDQVAEVPSIFSVSETESSAVAQPSDWGEAKLLVRCVDEKVIVKHSPESGDGEYVVVFGKRGHEYSHVIEAEDRAGAPQGGNPKWGAYYDLDGDGYADFRKKQSEQSFEKRTGESWATVEESDFLKAQASWVDLLQKAPHEEGLVWLVSNDVDIELLVASPRSWRDNSQYVGVFYAEGQIWVKQAIMAPDSDLLGITSFLTISSNIALLGKYGLYSSVSSSGTGSHGRYFDMTGDGYADWKGSMGDFFKERESEQWRGSNYTQLNEAYEEATSRKIR